MTLRALQIILITLMLSQPALAAVRAASPRSQQPRLTVDHLGLPTIVWYYTTWCPYCKQMMSTILEAEKHFSKELYILIVDIEDPRNKEIVEKYRLKDTGIPYSQFYDAQGNYLHDFIGAIPEDVFFAHLDQSFGLKRKLVAQ